MRDFISRWREKNNDRVNDMGYPLAQGPPPLAFSTCCTIEGKVVEREICKKRGGDRTETVAVEVECAVARKTLFGLRLIL